MRRLTAVCNQLTPSSECKEYVPALAGSVGATSKYTNAGGVGAIVDNRRDYSVATIDEGRYSFPNDIPSALTDEQKRQYERDGFFVVKGVVPPDDLEKYRRRFLEISTTGEKPPTMLVMRDVTLAKKGRGKDLGESNITKIQHLQDDEELFHYCAHPNVLKYVTGIVGPNCKAVHTMLINKPPDTGAGSSRHPPHQDLWYFPFRPASRIVCAWTAMQKIDIENGCLFVKPGSHNGPLYRHEYPKDGVVNRAYHGIQGQSGEEDGKKLFHCEMEAGDTIFFHPLLIHGSGRNNSTRFRKAISCHYADSDCHYVKMDGTIQEEIAKEVEQMAKAKGLEVEFEEFWRFTARLVAGKEGTL